MERNTTTLQALSISISGLRRKKQLRCTLSTLSIVLWFVKRDCQSLCKSCPMLRIGKLQAVTNELTLRPSLAQRILSLPSELQLHVITFLPLPTILSLRLTSKAFHSLVTVNESPITRYHLAHSIPKYALERYPVPDSSDLPLQHLCGLWHRLHVASKLANLIADHTTREVFLKNTPAKRRDFESQHRRMQMRLMPLMFTMFHFFERYRQLHLEHLENERVQVIDQITRVDAIERDIMYGYDDRTLLRLHEVFPLILSTFSRQLRPIAPPYRSSLAVSGCRVKRTNRPALGLVAEEQASDVDCADYNHSQGADSQSLESCHHTSPAAGMPTKPLSMDELLPLLAEHQSLQDIWCATAEEVILERRIVESSIQIKRNTQVLLDLIKEEWSGRDEAWEPGLHVEHTATTGYDGTRDFDTNFL